MMIPASLWLLIFGHRWPPVKTPILSDFEAAAFPRFGHLAIMIAKSGRTVNPAALRRTRRQRAKK
jgi:hypothetical protein